MRIIDRVNKVVSIKVFSKKEVSENEINKFVSENVKEAKSFQIVSVNKAYGYTYTIEVNII